jgi:uncharacterized coiled-coil protein SlyX
MSKWLDYYENSNKLERTYFNGFVDISGGSIHLRNGLPMYFYDSENMSTPSFAMNNEHMQIYDKNTGAYSDISNSQLIYIRDLSANTQSQLNDLANKMKYIQSDTSNAITLLKFDSAQRTTSIYGNLNVTQNMGVGVSNPQAPLDVVLGASFQDSGSLATYFSYDASAGSQSSSFKTDNYSVISRGSMLVAGNLVLTNATTFSDQRMKTNIKPVNKIQALDTVRMLQPKTFQYKDSFFHGEQQNQGFIAQDVRNIVPSAVNQIKKYIPNIYELANVYGNRILLNHSSTKQFLNVQRGEPVLIKLYDKNNMEIIVELVEIIDDNEFLISRPLDGDTIFVYGQEINDFLTIDKDAIFTLSVSALQLIDVELQHTKQTVKRLETVVALQQKQLEEIHESIARLSSTGIHLGESLLPSPPPRVPPPTPFNCFIYTLKV